MRKRLSKALKEKGEIFYLRTPFICEDTIRSIIYIFSVRESSCLTFPFFSFPKMLGSKILFNSSSKLWKFIQYIFNYAPTHFLKLTHALYCVAIHYKGCVYLFNCSTSHKKKKRLKVNKGTATFNLSLFFTKYES